MPRKTIICPQCGAEFQHSRNFRIPKYCSRRCWLLDTKKPIRFCAICQAPIARFASAYCSNQCANKAQRSDKDQIRERILAKRFIDPETECWNWTGSTRRRGYGRLQVNGKAQVVPRLSAHVFLGFDLKSKLLICHRCDNPSCFNPEHLFSGTEADNMADRDRKGRQNHPIGSLHPMAQLTEADVVVIRQLRAQGLKHKEIAAKFGISRTNVGLIVARKTWTNVP